MNRLAASALAATFALFALAPHSTLAWHAKTHRAAVLLALQAAKADLPAFLPAGAATVAHCSLDPDLFTRPIGPEPLNGAEAPEHFFDIELLKDAPAPAGRKEFIAWCARNDLEPQKIGLLPYAVTEWTQRLTVALAEHRADPNNPHVRTKCLVYAGLLAHYSADLCQPLHITIHWDGRAKSDGSSPRSGIHNRLDALPGKLKFDPAALLRDIKPAPLALLAPPAAQGEPQRVSGGSGSPAKASPSPLLKGVLDEIGRSHALVQRVYAMEKDIPAADAALDPNSPAAAFATERLKAAATFTACLCLTAWRDSQAIKLPSWYKREE